jgi:hypothetical protein
MYVAIVTVIRRTVLLSVGMSLSMATGTTDQDKPRRKPSVISYLLQFAALITGVGLLPTHGQSVSVDHGNVIHISLNGKKKAITQAGVDHDPCLSNDGASVVFVRDTGAPAGFEEPNNPHPSIQQILMADVRGAKGLEVLLTGPITLPDGSDYATFSSPCFSLDKSSLFFFVPASVTESFLVRFDRTTRSIRAVTPALSYQLIPSGKYAGYIIARVRKVEGDGLTNLFWLVSIDGTELGTVGENEADVRKFLDSHSRTVRH